MLKLRPKDYFFATSSLGGEGRETVTNECGLRGTSLVLTIIDTNIYIYIYSTGISLGYMTI